ncbi:seizure protein 6 homolog [Heterodontus francisci]|uniref:seizure protein 6 homolog n=1 Tax=Heterodontus francisci TaxID=7792 RepID=UPI00355B128C
MGVLQWTAPAVCILLVCVAGLVSHASGLPEPITRSTGFPKASLGSEIPHGLEGSPEVPSDPARLEHLLHGALLKKDLASDEKYFIGTMMNPTQPAPVRWSLSATTARPPEGAARVTAPPGSKMAARPRPEGAARVTAPPGSKMAARPTPEGAARVTAPPGSKMAPQLPSIILAASERGQGSPAGPATPTSEVDEETTTTLITTTTVTTVQTPVFCNLNLIEVDGLIESLEYSGSPFYTGLDCTYLISVYTGYAVELQVKTLNLLEGELLTVEGLQGDEPLILANEALMSEGQNIRTQSRQVLIHFQSSQTAYPGTFQFYCRAYLLSCGFPVRPTYGDVSVSDLSPGATAVFHCDPGFQLHGAASISCLNVTRPEWNSEGPQCVGEE